MSDDHLLMCCCCRAACQHIVEEKDAEIARLRLTDEEREALVGAEYEMANLADDTGSERDREIAAILRGLLKRTKGGER